MIGRLLGIGVLLSLGAFSEDSIPRLLEQFQAGPQTAILCDRVGIAYTRAGDLKSAEEFFRKALQKNPALVSARKNLGTVLWFQNRRTESVAEFQRVAKALPADSVAHLYLGLSAYDHKDFPTAVKHFEGAGSLASANPEVLPLMVEAFLGSGQPGKAIQVLESTLVPDQGDSKSWIQLGQAYDRANRPQDAYRSFQKAIEKSPGSDEAYLVLADFAAAHGNRAFARETLHRGIAANPQSLALMLPYGVQTAMDGDFEGAAQIFRSAQQLAPTSAAPLLALGVTELQAGKWDQAAKEFSAASRIDQNDYRAAFLYAFALSQSTNAATRKSEDDIHAAFTRAIALNPRHAGSRVAMAQHLLTEGRTKDARAELEAALHLETNNTAALYQMGLLYQRQGDSAEAERMMQRFRKAKAAAREDESQLIQILKTVQ